MFKPVAAAAFGLAVLAGPALADDDPTEEQVSQIMEMLAGMECEMDPGDIEMEDGGFELDDVYCADGQYDIDLDANMQITNKRAE
ncbi:PepSY domain-containing protein [Thalassococcus profundi]|uniref:PepSY domain-containing protein n=1 Tax=Thalassococcus profundi TaxID=2282382 RepID=A0A369TND0_9RHOB|nr:PepSY domain-containing protein [Thalassococcus profundi]RDD66690.1 PepSY domain-containing protein [Thalassococcus profundi]